MIVIDSKSIDRLRPARGYLDEVATGPDRVSGWILLPDAELDTVQVYADGNPVGIAPLEARPDVAGAYPQIPHASRSGFQLTPKPDQIQPGAVNHVTLVGCRHDRPLAHVHTVWFPRNAIPAVPTPPPQLVSRVQHAPDADLYRSQGFQYYLQFRDAIARHRDLKSVGRLLDWGCGCGRLAGYFLADPHQFRLSGCDIDPDAVAWCNEYLAPAEFLPISRTPSLPYPDASFDAVIAFGVFLCIAPEAQVEWLAELKRVLTPGGILVTSVQGAFSASFALPANDYARLLREGTFGDWRYFPGILQTREYTLREWSRHFEFLEYVEGEVNADHDLAVMRRPA